MSSSRALRRFLSVKKQKHGFYFVRSMYNKTIIRFGFSDIQNNQGLRKGYRKNLIQWLFIKQMCLCVTVDNHIPRRLKYNRLQNVFNCHVDQLNHQSRQFPHILKNNHTTFHLIINDNRHLFFTWLVVLCSSRLIIWNKPRQLTTVWKAGGGFDCNRGVRGWHFNNPLGDYQSW